MLLFYILLTFLYSFIYKYIHTYLSLYIKIALKKMPLVPLYLPSGTFVCTSKQISLHVQFIFLLQFIYSIAYPKT